MLPSFARSVLLLNQCLEFSAFKDVFSCEKKVMIVISFLAISQNFEANNAYLWWSEPSYFRGHVRHNHVSSFPWATELWPPEDVCQHGAVPAPALLHPRLRALDLTRFPAVPSYHRTGTDPANVWRQKYDGGLRSPARKISDSCLHV